MDLPNDLQIHTSSEKRKKLHRKDHWGLSLWDAENSGNLILFIALGSEFFPAFHLLLEMTSLLTLTSPK